MIHLAIPNKVNVSEDKDGKNDEKNGGGGGGGGGGESPADISVVCNKSTTHTVASKRHRNEASQAKDSAGVGIPALATGTAMMRSDTNAANSGGIGCIGCTDLAGRNLMGLW